MDTKGGECFRCVCKQTYSKFDPFLKILDLADIGLNIYRYLATKYAQVAGVSPQTTGAGLDVFILQNTRDEDLQSASYIKNLDTNKINCPKCKRILTRAKRLIETIPTVNKGNIIGICDHCRKRAEPLTSCDVCENIVKKFVTSEIKRNQQRPLRIGRSQSDLNLTNIRHGPERSDAAAAAGFYSTEPKWHEHGPGIRKQFEQKLIPCLVKSQHEVTAHDEIRKYFQKAALIRSRSETFIDAITGLTEEILDNTFHYYFPKDDEHGQPVHGRVMDNIYYDKYGKPVHGRGMPKVYYDEHGQPIHGRGVPEVYYDKHGQPIQGRGMPEVYYDKHGQPIQGRGMPEVYYDKHGQPIQARGMPEVYYDKHGQPIQGRGMPEVYYDEHGQPIHGRGMPEVYYDEHGQPIHGRGVPEVYYDKHGQPIQVRGMPEVYYDKHGQPIQGRGMPEVYYDKHGQPIQGRGVPEVYYDKHGQPIQGRGVPEVYYDKHGQPIQGRGMPEVYYDKHGQPIQGRGMPEDYYDKHGQPIQGRGVPEVYYDKHGQPIQGRGVPEVYYDKHGQPIQGRGMPEVYYDKHGQPIQGRGVPEVYYDKHGQPIQGRGVPEVYYDKHGQQIQGRGMPEVYYDKHGQPIQGRGVPGVNYDKHGQPIQGRGMPEVYYNKHGQPIQGRGVPEVYYDKHGQPIRGRGMPEVYYDKHGQPIQGSRKPEVYDGEEGHPIQERRMAEVYYDKHGRPVPAGRTSKDFDKHGKPIARAKSQEVYYDKQGWPVQAGRKPDVYHDKQGQPIAKAKSSEFYDKHRERPPDLAYDKEGRPISRGKSPGPYYDQHGKPTQGGRRTAQKVLHSSTEIPETRVHGRGKSAGGGAEMDDKSKRQMRRDEEGAKKVDRAISGGKEKSQLPSRGFKSTTQEKFTDKAKPSARSKEESIYESKRSEGKEKVSKAKDTEVQTKDVPRSKQESMHAAGKSSVEKEKVPKATGAGAKDIGAPAKDVPSKGPQSKQEVMQTAGKSSVEKEKVPKATGAGAKDIGAPAKDVPSKGPQSKQEAMQTAGKSSVEKEKVSKATGAGAKDTVAPTKDVPRSKQEAMQAAGKSSAEKEKGPKATGAGAKDIGAPAKDVPSKVPQSKQEAMQAAGKSSAEKEKVLKATGAGAKDTVAPAKDVPGKVAQSKQEAMQTAGKSGVEKEKVSIPTGTDAKLAPSKDVSNKRTQIKQDAMQAAGKSGAEKEKVTKADGPAVKDQKQKSTDGAKQGSEEETLKRQRLQETMKQKELAEKKLETKDLKKEKAGGGDSKVRASASPPTGKQKGDEELDNQIKEAKRKKEDQIKQKKEEEEKQKTAKQKAEADKISKKIDASEALAAKTLNEQYKQKLEEEKQKKANEEQLKKLKDNMKTVPPVPQANVAGDRTDKIIRTDQTEDPRKQVFKIDESMVSKIARMDNTKAFDKPNVELNLKAIILQKPSMDDIVTKVVTVKPRDKTAPIKTEKELERLGKAHKLHERVGKEDELCDICYYSELQYQLEEITRRKQVKERKNAIVGNKLKTVKDITKDIMKIDEEGQAPTLFKTKFTIESTNVFQKDQEPPSDEQPQSKQIQTDLQQKGVIKYQLSDRSFIEKGWTLLPTEKVVRKMNVYRMRPAHPEFDWFERNKNKRCMEYDTGEKLAEFTDNGRGRWFYRNGRVALEYYDAEDTNAQHRVLIFSSGEPDDRGRTHPYTILGSFDHMGSAVVFDHGGKIRLKYNQSEGIILDRSLGPVSHWKWHSLNDPPVLQQVMIDTQMSHKDPDILKMGDQTESVRPDNEDMLAIEFDNFIKEKSKKLSQKFKPFQIKMKALKINEHFSLKILDQASIYLIFRDGTTNLKLNLGMLIDHKEIVDTDTAEMGDVANNIEKLPARTDSIAGIQATIDNAQQEARLRLERERRLRPSVARASADQLRAAASRPPRRPIHPAPSSGSTSRKPSQCNLYYNTRII